MTAAARAPGSLSCRGTLVDFPAAVPVQLGHGAEGDPPLHWNGEPWWSGGRSVLHTELSDQWAVPLGLARASHAAGEIRTDDCGVWLRVTLRRLPEPLGAWLAEDVERGRLGCLSGSWVFPDGWRGRSVRAARYRPDVVHLGHIALCRRGRYPSARCWIDDSVGADGPPPAAGGGVVER